MSKPEPPLLIVMLSIPELTAYVPENPDPPPPVADRLPAEYPVPESSIEREVMTSSFANDSQNTRVSINSSESRTWLKLLSKPC